MPRKTKVSEDQAGLGLGPVHTDDATTVDYARPPEKASTRKEPDLLQRMSESRSVMWRIGVCEGAAMFRKRMLGLFDSEPNDPDDDAGEIHETRLWLLGLLGEVDEMFEKQFGDEYTKQIEARTT